MPPMTMPDTTAPSVTMPAMTPLMDTPDLQTAVTPRNDDLVNVGLGQLSEARKQTLLLETLVMPTAPTPIQLQEYEVPLVVKQVESEVTTETEAAAQVEGATQPANNVTLNLTINQAPGQDPEELAKIIMRQINESTGTFLVQ